MFPPPGAGAWLRAGGIYLAFLALWRIHVHLWGGGYSAAPAGRAAFDLAYAAMLFLSVVPGPVFEEILCRGIGLAVLLRKYDHVGSVVATSAVFSLMHGQWSFFHFCMGVMLAIVRIRTKSLYCAIGVHGLHNLLVMLREAGVW